MQLFGTRSASRCAILPMALLCLIPASSFAEEIALPPIAITRLPQAKNSKNCGLYCFLAAARIYGQTIDLDGLFRPEYLTGTFGSTAEDLCRAARASGLQAEARSGLSYWDLCSMDTPVICLIRPTFESHAYSHWVLLTRARLDRLDLYDSDAGAVSTTPAKFMALWDGIGVFISRPKESAFMWTRYADQVLVLFTVLLAGYALLILPVARLSGRLGVARILVVALVLAGLFHTLVPFGLADNLRDAKLLAGMFHDAAPRFISVKELPDRARSALIIDARIPASFSRGHIPGAINIPVNSSVFRLETMLSSVPDDRPMIVYCESEQCGWAAELAGNAVLKRFSKVSVLEGGFDSYTRSGLPVSYN